MKTSNVFTVLLTVIMTSAIYSQDRTEVRNEINKGIIKKKVAMKTYLIEREIPEAGKMTAEQLKGISQKSFSVLKEMGSDIEWLHSYVALPSQARRHLLFDAAPGRLTPMFTGFKHLQSDTR